MRFISKYALLSQSQRVKRKEMQAVTVSSGQSTVSDYAPVIIASEYLCCSQIH
jgi:hypothetical protein